MMSREEILTELESRCFSVPGVVRVARNPENPPTSRDFPAIHIIELEERVMKQSKSNRADSVTYLRQLMVAIELFAAGTTDALASRELGEFVQLARSAIHAGGPTLGNRCWLHEVDSTRVEIVAVGDHVRAIGYGYEIQYSETI